MVCSWRHTKIATRVLIRPFSTSWVSKQLSFRFLGVPALNTLAFLVVSRWVLLEITCVTLLYLSCQKKRFPIVTFTSTKFPA